MSETLTQSGPAKVMAAEKVRLVIWDLDETFWTGTLTEGGITYRRDVHDIVLELARRGIISSICSKNDLARVRAVLEAEGIWDHFIFPSVDWTPKGPRLAALVEAVQLRPPTILFIDDNPMNLNEALHFVPGLQVADETFVGRMLDDPRFVGKNDRDLTRLAQYRLLERRHADEVAATAVTGSNHDFLRKSNIRVRIDHDVEANLDRAIELINRTNQLNFTKWRLPEEPVAARAKLHELLTQFETQAALIWVTDDYGDYGCVGFYAMRMRFDGSWKLQHFCFSCRTLNMGVEQWVYAFLGRPELTVAGEVLGSVDDPAVVDWITPVADADGARAAASGPALQRVALRGGCDLTAIAHYFGVHAREMVGEYHPARNGMPVRNDHSLFLRHALDGLDNAAIDLCSRLGYLPEDFRSRVFETPPGGLPSIVLLSFQIDAAMPIYRHRASGLKVPFVLPMQVPGGVRVDARGLDDAVFERAGDPSLIAGWVNLLRAEFDYLGPSTHDDIETNIGGAIDAIPPGVQVFVFDLNDTFTGADGKPFRHGYHTQFNGWLADVMKRRPRATLIRVRDLIEDECEVQSLMHFARPVYHRLFRRVMQAAIG